MTATQLARGRGGLSCVCGHVSGHHQATLGSGDRPCEWRDCGCPRFIQARSARRQPPTEPPLTMVTA